MTDLSDHVALVTGGTSGIGLSTAEELLHQGARVAISARTPKSHLELLGGSFGDNVLFVSGDISKPETPREIVDAVAAKFGKLDLIVHAAGGNVPGGIEAVSTEEWMSAFDVHVHSIFHLFRASLPYLRQRGGSVMLLSSVAGLRGCPQSVSYQTVKGALPQLARALARDHAEEDIRINCVAPGIIRTPFNENMSENARKNNIENRIPLRREGTPEDVAKLIVTMLTNRFITGECFTIDGGMTMRIA